MEKAIQPSTTYTHGSGARLIAACTLATAAIALLLLLLSPSAQAAPSATCWWIGPDDLIPRDWSSVAYWDCGHVPGPEDVAVIQNYGRIVNVDGPVVVQSLSLLNQAALHGYHTLTVTDRMEWGGNIVGGSWLSPTGALETVVIGPSAYLTISSSSRLIQGRLVNYGTSTQLPNQVNTLFRSVFDNRPGGTMRVQSGCVDGYWNSVDDAGLIHNRGRLIAEGDTEFTLNVGLTNDGLIEVPTGALKIQLPSNRQIVTHTGTISITAPGLLILNGYEHRFDASSSIAGGGVFRLENGARAVVWGRYDVTGLTDIGNVNTLLDLHTPDGTVALPYLQMGNSTDLAGSSQITVTRAMTIAESRGLIHGSTGVSDTFNIAPGAYMLVNNTGGISHRTLNNYGVIEQRSPHCFSVLAQAIFNNQPTGVYAVSRGSIGSCIPFVSPDGILINWGRVDKSSPETFEIPSTVPVINNGSVLIREGVLRADSFTQNDGETRLFSGSTLSAQTGGLEFNGGTLRGSGTIDLFQDQSLRNGGATIDPEGVLALDEEYSQGVSATLHVDIGGLTPGSGYDQFQVGGHAALDGRLVLSPTAGFTPASGDVFQVMTYGSRSGEFQEVVHGLGLAFGPEYLPNGIIISDNPALVEFGQRPDNRLLAPGDQTGFALRLSNTHSETVRASLQNDLPEGFLFVEGSATSNIPLPAPSVGGRAAVQSLLWPTVEISPSAVVTIHFSAAATQNIGVYTNTATAYVTPTLRGPRTIRLHENVEVLVSPVKETVIKATNATAYPSPEANGLWTIAVRRGTPASIVGITVESTPVCTQTACGPLKHFYVLHDRQSFPFTPLDGTINRYRAEIPQGQFNLFERIFVVTAFHPPTARNVSAPSAPSAPGDCERVGGFAGGWFVRDPSDGSLSPCRPNTDPPRIFDPSGFVTDAQNGAPVAGATVTLHRLPGALPDGRTTTNDCRTVDTRPNNSWSSLPIAGEGQGRAEEPGFSPPTMDPDVNPLKTDESGYYGWDVVRGCWYVKVEAMGYHTAYSPVVGVPPEVTDLDIQLEPLPAQEYLYLPAVLR